MQCHRRKRQGDRAVRLGHDVEIRCVVRIALHQGPPADGVDYAKGPHPVVTVELEEQPALRFTSTIVDCALDDIQIGMPVELAWIERSGAPYPVFRSAGEGR